MKRRALAALLGMFATISIATVADAGGRQTGFRGDRDNGSHSGRSYHSWHHGQRPVDQYGPECNGFFGPCGLFGFWGPTVIYAPEVVYEEECFYKKVRRYDHAGNAYIKRVRVCLE